MYKAIQALVNDGCLIEKKQSHKKPFLFCNIYYAALWYIKTNYYLRESIKLYCEPGRKKNYSYMNENDESSQTTLA